MACLQFAEFSCKWKFMQYKARLTLKLNAQSSQMRPWMSNYNHIAINTLLHLKQYNTVILNALFCTWHAKHTVWKGHL